MGSGSFVNLNEAGGLAQQGQNYGTNAEDHSGSARKFMSSMEASQKGLIGNAGTTFSNVSNTTGSNHMQLAQRIAEQAYRAVQADKHIQTGDENAHSAQSGAQSTVESNTGLVSRPINV